MERLFPLHGLVCSDVGKMASRPEDVAVPGSPWLSAESQRVL